MVSFKSSIYSKEWLDIVFANRNKAYGAYQLRLFSGKATTVALLIVVCVALGLSGLSFISRPNAKDISPTLEEISQPVTLTIEKEVPKEPIAEEQTATTKVQQVAQDISARDLVKFTEINPTAQPKAEEDIADQSEVLDKRKLVASIRMKGQPGGELITRGTLGTSTRDGGSRGNSMGDIEGSAGKDNTPFISVEVMPTPKGGMSAFVQWIAKNYTFPQSAVDNNVKGLIQIKFVVEEDGSLSSFEVLRDMGFGTGQEAVKLLQRAKKWNPGVQNGRPVRVAFTLPIRLSTE